MSEEKRSKSNSTDDSQPMEVTSRHQVVRNRDGRVIPREVSHGSAEDARTERPQKSEED